MFLQSFTLAILGLSTLAHGFAVPAPLNPRAASTCNADNCLRAFRATSPSSRIADASSFCSSYLSTSVPANTQYTTTTTTTTVTAATQTITGSTIVVTTTTSEATITIATSTYGPSVDPLAPFIKRQPNASTPPSSPQTYPAYASQCGTTSQAARISSACSCLLKSAGTTTATVTATATTSTTPLTTSTPTTTTTLTTITGTGTITSFVAPSYGTVTV